MTLPSLAFTKRLAGKRERSVELFDDNTMQAAHDSSTYTVVSDLIPRSEFKTPLSLASP